MDTTQKPSLFLFANCASRIIEITNAKGAELFITHDGLNFKQKNKLVAVNTKITSPGLTVCGRYYNSPLGCVLKDDASISTESTFENTLIVLKSLAMPESWDYTNSQNGRPLPILYNYLLHTFAKIKEEDKISYSDKLACFNTGLVTNNQEEIFMLFRKKKDGKYVFQDFCKESSNELTKFNTLPSRANYFVNVTDLIYDTSCELRINIDHIVNDPDNFQRFPDQIRSLPKHQLVNTFSGAIEHAKKRIKRNYLTAVPQYYRGQNSNGQLQLLLPLCLIEPSKADLALAVYKSDGVYSGRTCLTLDMAINNARLITKPDDEWLKP